jgi:hypothetical protein
MAEMVKIIGTEIALSTANTVGGASVVRVYNNTAGAVLVTRANSGTLGTVTLAAGEIIYLQKASAETLASNAAVRAVSVAFN